MQADEPAFEKVFDFHFFPTVVVSIADHKTRQDKEEINGQVAMIDPLI